MLKKRVTYLGYLGCLLILGGLFLPFVYEETMYSKRIIGFVDADGIILLVGIVICLTLILFNKGKLIIIPTIISLAVLLYDLNNIFNMIDIFGDEEIYMDGLDISYSLGIGTYIIFIGLTLLFVYRNLLKKED